MGPLCRSLPRDAGDLAGLKALEYLSTGNGGLFSNFLRLGEETTDPVAPQHLPANLAQDLVRKGAIGVMRL